MLNELRKIFADLFHIVRGDLREDTSFSKDLGLNSLDLFSLSRALSEAFKLPIPEKVLFLLDDPRSLMNFLKENGIED